MLGDLEEAAVPRGASVPIRNAGASTAVMVFLICRVRLYHDAILAQLNRQPGVVAVGAIGPETNLLCEIEAVGPDVVLLDAGAPEALALAARLARAPLRARLLGFGVDEDPSQVMACAEAGFWAYVPSSASIAELARAARRVAAGEPVCPGAMADRLFHHIRNRALDRSAAPDDLGLTMRQLEILHLIKKGLSNKQIANRLSLGTSTVKNHVHGLLGRLHVARRDEAAARVRPTAD